MISAAAKMYTCTFAIIVLHSCCPQQQKYMQEAALNYYTHEKEKIDGMHYYVQNVRIVNVRKYSCDSVNAYVRVIGSYKNISAADSLIPHKFDKASTLTMVRRGQDYKVVKEVVEED